MILTPSPFPLSKESLSTWRYPAPSCSCKSLDRSDPSAPSPLVPSPLSYASEQTCHLGTRSPSPLRKVWVLWPSLGGKEEGCELGRSRRMLEEAEGSARAQGTTRKLRRIRIQERWPSEKKGEGSRATRVEGCRRGETLKVNFERE